MRKSNEREEMQNGRVEALEDRSWEGQEVKSDGKESGRKTRSKNVEKEQSNLCRSKERQKRLEKWMQENYEEEESRRCGGKGKEGLGGGETEMKKGKDKFKKYSCEEEKEEAIS